MKYLGIDVSSKKLNIHLTDDHHQSFDFEIENSKEAVVNFVKEQKLKVKQCIIGAESTGKYHLPCQEVFVNQGFEFRLLNPILTKKVISSTIRKKKTDKSDAEIITFLLKQNEGKVIVRQELETTKKSILRARSTLVKHRSALKLLVAELKRNPINI